MTKCLNPSCKNNVKQTPGKRRRDYCSNACRQQAHYRRSGKTKITLIQEPDGLWSVQDPDGTVRKCRLEWVIGVDPIKKPTKKGKSAVVMAKVTANKKGEVVAEYKSRPDNTYLAKRRGLKNGG